MKNTKLQIIFVLSIFLLLSCESDSSILEESGDIISETRTLDVFDKIEVSQGIKVVIIENSVQSVQVITSANILPKVLTKVSNGRLVAEIQGSISAKTLRIEIGLPKISEIKLNSSSDGVLSGFQDIPNLKVAVSDGSDLAISGSSNSLQAVLSGAATLKGLDFTTSTCNAKLSSISKMSISCSTNLSGTVSGSSELMYKGNPKIDVELSSLGQLVKLD